MTFGSGSHRLGNLGDLFISDHSHAELDRRIAELGLATHTHGALAAGDATFHAGWTLHSAPANPSGTLREVMTVIYFADGTRVGPADHPIRAMDLRTWLHPCQPGDPATGDLNPLLLVAPSNASRDAPWHKAEAELPGSLRACTCRGRACIAEPRTDCADCDGSAVLACWRSRIGCSAAGVTKEEISRNRDGPELPRPTKHPPPTRVRRSLLRRSPSARRHERPWSGGRGARSGNKAEAAHPSADLSPPPSRRAIPRRAPRPPRDPRAVLRRCCARGSRPGARAPGCSGPSSARQRIHVRVALADVHLEAPGDTAEGREGRARRARDRRGAPCCRRSSAPRRARCSRRTRRSSRAPA